MKKILCFCFYSFMLLSAAQAQSFSLSELKEQMIKDWKRAKAYTQEYLDAMPADKYGFRPADSIRSFAEQMLHFAQANAGSAFIGTGVNNVAGQVFRRPDFAKLPAAQNKDSVMYYVNTSYDIMINAIKDMDFGKLGEEVSFDLPAPAGKRIATRLGWLLKAFEHQTHHRGQCTIYLRLQGVRPPAEKLWDL